VVFFGKGQVAFEKFCAWLVGFEHRKLGVVRDLLSEEMEWCVAVEDLRSAMPMVASVRQGVVSGISAYVALDPAATIAKPVCLYRPWDAHPASEPVALPFPASFTELPQAAAITTSRPIPHATAVPVSLSLSVGIDRRRPASESLQRKRERLAARFERELAMLECDQRIEKEYEQTLVLTIVPAAATAVLQHLLCTLPLDEIRKFKYLPIRDEAGDEMHVVKPEQRGASFPPVTGAVEVECPVAWIDAGLPLFLGSDLALTLPFHAEPGYAKKIKQALLGGTANGEIIACFDTATGRRELALPGFDKFHPLDHAITLMNRTAISRLDDASKAAPLRALWKKVDAGIVATERNLIRRQEQIATSAETFFTTAAGDIQKCVDEFDKLASGIAALRSKVDGKRTDIKNRDQDIDELARCVDRKQWEECLRKWEELKPLMEALVQP